MEIMRNGVEIVVETKCIFKFMINIARLASNSVYGKEKCLKCINFTPLDDYTCKKECKSA